MLRAETRGESSEINEYMFTKAKDVAEGAARMYDVDVSLTVQGRADQEMPSPELLPFVRDSFADTANVAEIRDHSGGSGFEDATVMMQRVKERGGLATYIQIGMDTSWGHHTERFDVDEDMLAVGVESELRLALGAADFLRELGRID